MCERARVRRRNWAGGKEGEKGRKQHNKPGADSISAQVK